MGNTYTSIFYHFVYSTKNRVPWLGRDIAPRVWEYIGGIARKHKMKTIKIGGTMDHIHVLIRTPPVYSPSQIVQHLKGDSSKWIHEEFPKMGGFAWQDGYGAFSVGASQVDEVKRYIQNQHEHHRIRTFQEEYLEFLKEHGIQYDERYLWG